MENHRRKLFAKRITNSARAGELDLAGVAALWIAVVFVLVALCAGVARGQGRQGRTSALGAVTGAQLILARVCVKEAGWEITDDCAAIHAVFSRGAARAGISYLAFARAYSPSAFSADVARERFGAARAWVAELSIDGRRPPSWPMRTVERRRGAEILRVLSGPSWPAHRARWFAMLAHAGEILAGAHTHACVATEPDHWGGAMDHARGVRAGWRVIDCGRTRNEFWSTR